MLAGVGLQKPKNYPSVDPKYEEKQLVMVSQREGHISTCLWIPLGILKATYMWIPLGAFEAAFMWIHVGISGATCMWIPLDTFKATCV